MRLVLVHLSDIHFRLKNNPVSDRVGQIASAIISADPSARSYLIVVSGDIAFSGDRREYEVAIEFFTQLKGRILLNRAGTEVWFVSIPGNHDCVLPEEKKGVRDALIAGLMPSLQEPEIDKGLLKSVLEAQNNYNKFREQFTHACDPWDGICQTALLQQGDTRIQVNLYNTALLSRRQEVQGGLQVPLKFFGSRVRLLPEAALSISVLHHSYVWLESNNYVGLRSHLERTSDLVLMGHQHVQHGFYKTNSTGERLLYIEGGALQEENYPQHSMFQVLLFDLLKNEEMSIQFRWDGDLYKRGSEVPWRPLTLNRSLRNDFEVTEEFQQFLDDLGFAYAHKVKGELRLRDIYVYPDVRLRKQRGKASSSEVRGDDVFRHVLTATRVIFQGSAFSGKTSLAKTLFGDLLEDGKFIPLLLDGKKISASGERRISEQFWSTVAREYGSPSVERFRQLQKEKCVLIIDDWHDSELNAQGRRAYLQVVEQYFGKVILFTDEIYQIQELADRSTEVMLEFDHATLLELGNVRRGVLIDKWMSLGREHTARPETFAREIEETERFVQSVIGRNTLPALPFIVLCILEVQQEDKPESPEAGSFGYLYEVLVTRALSASLGRKPQLEKKYTFLSMLAYRMFKEDVESIPASRVRELLDEYSRSFRVRVDAESLLQDLEEGRVLVNLQGNYSFGQAHLFHYFVARYYKDNLGRENGGALRREISDLVDHMSVAKNSTILMFTLYFARDSAAVIDKLVSNADRIYDKEGPASLESDVDFLLRISNREEFDIPKEIDIEADRRERREFRDRIERSGLDVLERRSRDYVYSDDLPDSDKFRLAVRHIELLGQVIRNFPGSLPGPDKLRILRASYLLGLRVLRVLLRLLENYMGDFRKAAAEVLLEERGKRHLDDVESVRQAVEQFIFYVGQLFALGMIVKVASDVGLADLEDAYAEVLNEIGKTNATRLIDMAIKLEHSRDFPESEIGEMHESFSGNHLADALLTTLVIANMKKYGVDRRLLQRISSILGLKANAPALVEATQQAKRKKRST